MTIDVIGHSQELKNPMQIRSEDAYNNFRFLLEKLQETDAEVEANPMPPPPVGTESRVLPIISMGKGLLVSLACLPA